MNPLDRPVRVLCSCGCGRVAPVVPSDVVAAHNAQTEDPADHLVTMKAPLYWMQMKRERDELRADLLRAADYMAARNAEVKRLREELRDTEERYDALREALDA